MPIHRREFLKASAQSVAALAALASGADPVDAAVAGAKVLEELVSPVPAHKGGRICFLEGPEGIQLELVEIVK